MQALWLAQDALRTDLEHAIEINAKLFGRARARSRGWARENRVPIQILSSVRQCAGCGCFHAALLWCLSCAGEYCAQCCGSALVPEDWIYRMIWSNHEKTPCCPKCTGRLAVQARGVDQLLLVSDSIDAILCDARLGLERCPCGIWHRRGKTC